MDDNSTNPLLNQQATPSGCSREVTWSLAYFWLVSLAINSMTQPSGQICGLPCQRAYYYLARSSPIICAFDSVSILVNWLSRIFFCLENPRKAATRVLAARFERRFSSEATSTATTLGAIDGDDGGDPVAALSDQIVPRYVAFILGVFPQCLKLFASSGIPWTQAIGAMYLASWVLFELLYLSADTKSLTTRKEPLHHENPWPQLANWQVQKYWGYAAVFTHAVFWSALPLLGVFRDIGGIFLVIGLQSACYSISIYWPYVNPDSMLRLNERATSSQSFSVRDFKISLSAIQGFVGQTPAPIILSATTALIAAVIFSSFSPSALFAAFAVALVLFDFCFSRMLSKRYYDYVATGMCFCVALVHPLMYFYFSFEGTGSFRPEWLDYLG